MASITCRGTTLLVAGLTAALCLAACGGDEQDEAGESAPEGRSFAEIDATDSYRVEEWASTGQPLTVLDFLPDRTALAASKGGWEGAGTAEVVHLAEDGTALARVLDLPVCTDAERGLIGLAVDPDFAENESVYLYYTRDMGDCYVQADPGIPPAGKAVNNRLSRFRLRDGALVDEEVLIDGVPGWQSSHNGGALAFDPQGRLMVGIGEATLGELASDPSALVGKVLRIDPWSDGLRVEDNPFADQPPPAAYVYAMGLRNPFGISVNQSSGVVIVADVGVETYEELNLIEPGADYGWPNSEGPSDSDSQPFLWYDHSEGCGSVLGAQVLDSDALLGDMDGWTTFTDFLCAKVWATDTDAGVGGETRLIAELDANPTHNTLGPDGALYISDTNGSVWRVTAQ